MSKFAKPRIGFHAPIKGGLHESLIIAKETGCDAVQIFSRNPRGWMAKPLTPDSVKLFKKTRKLTRLSPVLIHANYLINLAASDEVLLLKSIASFREEVERAIVLGVDYLVLHPGSARGSCEADAIEVCALSLQVACQGLKFGRRPAKRSGNELWITWVSEARPLGRATLATSTLMVRRKLCRLRF